jgi:hypothetical protein
VVLVLAVAAGLASLGAPPSETRQVIRRRVRDVAHQGRSFSSIAPAVSLQAA